MSTSATGVRTPSGPSDREPSVSVVIAAYRSHRTIRRSLEHLAAQTLQPSEVVVCDSSPDERTARIVEEYVEEYVEEHVEQHPTQHGEQQGEHPPRVRLIRSERRLLPQQARALGVEATASELLLFTDPDVYAEPEWIERLVALHRERAAAVVGGAIACWDRDWLNRGIHVCKFGRWLPGGAVRAVDNVPTASLMIARTLYQQLGGFDHPLYGDAQLSRRAAEHGPVLLEPAALAHHDHATTLREFARERFQRGLQVGRDGGRKDGRGKDRKGVRLLITLLPVRLGHSLCLSCLDCRRGPGLATWLRSLPIVALGHAVSLAGEARGLAGEIARGRDREADADQLRRNR